MLSETPPPELDLNAYFERIGLRPPEAPNLQTLAAIHQHHTQTIPFENLDPLLRRPVLLDIESLQRKLIHNRRGGWCFEHNLLFAAALRKIGFQITNLAARVLWNAPDNHIGPRSHMVLLIHLDGERYIADAGFGGQTLTTPLRLIPGLEQETPHGVFRLLAAADSFEMQALIDNIWKPLYRFDLQPQFLADYEVTSWYLSNHPECFFVTSLIAARPAADCRYALRNNQFTVHRLSGETETRNLSTAAELRDTLEKTFLIKLPDAPELDQALTRLTAASQ
jgi:N-hydroxyarylamine O-acetyltransferase